MVVSFSGTKISLKIALRIYLRSISNADIRVSLVRLVPVLCFFVRWIEISRNGEFETYEFERLFGGLEDDVLRDYVVRHQISRDMTVNFVPSVKSD